MDNVSICASIIAALLGIAYPILFEVTSRLDEKYSSQIIQNLFRRERENRYFILLLKISLGCILLWMFKLPPLIKIKRLDHIIQNSAEYLIIITTGLLVISFFFFIKKISLYYSPFQILPTLIIGHDKETQSSD